MKRIALLLTPLFILALGISQPPQGRGEPPARLDEDRILETVDRMTLELSLTDDQREQILGIYLTHVKDMKDNQPAHGMVNDRSRMGRIEDKGKNTKRQLDSSRNHREELEKNILSILTEEQKKKYQAMHEERRPDGKRQRPPQRGYGRK